MPTHMPSRQHHQPSAASSWSEVSAVSGPSSIDSATEYNAKRKQGSSQRKKHRPPPTNYTNATAEAGMLATSQGWLPGPTTQVADDDGPLLNPPSASAVAAGGSERSTPSSGAADGTPPRPPKLPKIASASSSSWDMMSPAQALPVRVHSSNSIDAVIISCAGTPSPSKWVTLDDALNGSDVGGAMAFDVLSAASGSGDGTLGHQLIDLGASADWGTLTPLSPRQLDALSSSAHTPTIPGTPIDQSLVCERSARLTPLSMEGPSSPGVPASGVPTPIAANGSAAAGSANGQPSANCPHYFLLRLPTGEFSSKSGKSRSLLLRTQLPGGSVGSAAVMHGMRKLAHALKSAKSATKNVDAACEHPLAPPVADSPVDLCSSSSSSKSQVKPQRATSTTAAQQSQLPPPRFPSSHKRGLPQQPRPLAIARPSADDISANAQGSAMAGQFNQDTYPDLLNGSASSNPGPLRNLGQIWLRFVPEGDDHRGVSPIGDKPATSYTTQRSPTTHF